jgi:HAD superfamily hydrolase (TIGR01509 family)
MTIAYLLWDNDGVLVDTERLYFQATRVVLGEVGVALSRDRYLEWMAVGRSRWELARAEGHSERDIAALRQRRDQLYQGLLRAENIEIEGVCEVLSELASRYRMAIVTSARREDFELIHESRDILRHFSFVVVREDYPNAKPAPDAYALGLQRFGARPDQALAIEDSSRGLASARAAGVACVVVKNAFTAAQNFAGARQVIDSVRELPKALESEQTRAPAR